MSDRIDKWIQEQKKEHYDFQQRYVNKYPKIEKCPKCGSDVHEHYDKKGRLTEAACSNTKCKWHYSNSGKR